MSTQDELDEQALNTAQKHYLDGVIDSYKDEVNPKAMDEILRVVNEKGEGAEGVERRLAGHVRSRAVAGAKANTDFSSLEDKFEEMVKKGLEDSGFNDPRPNHEIEPELEPEPFGMRQPSESDSFEIIRTKYGSGEIDTTTYEREREKRGLEPMRA